MIQAAGTAPIAVVVLSFGPRTSLPRAVKSVLQQDVPAEIVVVHSGPGDAAQLLTAAGMPDIPVVSVPHRLYAGGARNVGIVHTTAAIVAYLADDHEAAPGWLKGRLAGHAAGYQAVACAVVPRRPYNPVSLCWHYAILRRRLPGARTRMLSHHGVSYDRSLFSRVGTFREDCEGAEDSEFNARVSAVTPILFSSDVVTKHDSPTTLRAEFRDNWSRDVRATNSAVPTPTRHRPRTFGIRAVGEFAYTARLLDPLQRVIFLLAWPLSVTFDATYRWWTWREHRKLARTSGAADRGRTC